MVSATYDIFNRQEIPDFILCNPNLDQLYSLKSATKKSVTRRFNSTSEVNIEIPKEVNGVDVPAYDYLKQKRLILVDDNESGYFVIVDSREDSDGAIPKKIVKGLSIDFNLVKRRLTAFGGTYPLYDAITPLDSLLGIILTYIPSWSIGEIDYNDLGTTFRTFDVADTNIYQFLMTDVAEAYNCVIIFDTTLKEISAKSLDKVTIDTDVFISHHNLVKTSSFKEISDELSTALNVTGGGNLSINAVNPLGTNIIYNFDYYKDGEGWMSAGLISAINAWEALILVNQPAYASTLTSLKTSNEDLVVLNGELALFEAQYSALEGVRLVQIEAGVTDLSAINALLDAKQVEIDLKENDITNTESTISTLQDTLESINDTVSFENNFDVAQLEELDEFIVENSYQNENIVQLDTDTPDIVQTQAQFLYDQAIEVLERISQPKYEFDVDSVDMLSLKEFESVSDQLELGSIVHMQNASEQNLELILLEIQYDYTAPDQFNLVFSNRLRLSNGAFLYSDIQGKAVKTGSKVSYDNYKWGDWEAYYKDDVSTFITSNLDASVNALISGENEQLLINENGLRLRKWDTLTEEYDPAQMWMNSKSLMFTKDNWNTASLGIGRITHDGSDVYGVIGEAIVGTLLAGNELRIANSGGNFTMDETGASLIDASFSLSTTGGKNEIYIDPTVGIKIVKDDGGTPFNTFYLDPDGNAVFAGELKAASGSFEGSITADEGSIGGMEITSEGIDVDPTHYIHNDGEIKWGSMWLKANGDAQFGGTIYADKLDSSVKVDWNQIINAPLPASQFGGSGSGYSASGIDTGTLSGNRVNGGTITGGGVSIGLDSFGILELSGSDFIFFNASDVRCLADFQVQDDLVVGDNAEINGDLTINKIISGGFYGSTTTFSVGGGYLDKTLTFRNGILTGWSFS